MRKRVKSVSWLFSSTCSKSVPFCSRSVCCRIRLTLIPLALRRRTVTRTSLLSRNVEEAQGLLRGII